MPTQRTGPSEMFRKTLISRAREMRKNLTAAELLIWSRLRGDQLGTRFRRQHRIGSYIADFYCASAKLVIEIDSDSHNERQEYDAKRTYWINQHGINVVRFTNEDVMTNMDNVLELIVSLCSNAANPSPQPSPRRTGKREQGKCDDR